MNKDIKEFMVIDEPMIFDKPVIFNDNVVFRKDVKVDADMITCGLYSFGKTQERIIYKDTVVESLSDVLKLLWKRKYGRN